MLDIAGPVLAGAAMEASLGCITMHPDGKAEALFVDGKTVCPQIARSGGYYLLVQIKPYIPVSSSFIIQYPIGGFIVFTRQVGQWDPRDPG